MPKADIIARADLSGGRGDIIARANLSGGTNLPSTPVHVFCIHHFIQLDLKLISVVGTMLKSER